MIQMQHLADFDYPPPLHLQASAAARHPLASAPANMLSPLTLPQLPQLLYPCSHPYCQTRRLLLTVTATVTGTLTLTLSIVNRRRLESHVDVPIVKHLPW